MSDELPIKFSDAAAVRVKQLIEEEENPDLKLRVYVTGGGCSGFQYGLLLMKKPTLAVGLKKRCYLSGRPDEYSILSRWYGRLY